MRSYIIYRDDVEIASVGAGTLCFTNTKRMQGWPYSYRSVLAAVVALVLLARVALFFFVSLPRRYAGGSLQC